MNVKVSSVYQVPGTQQGFEKVWLKDRMFDSIVLI